MSNQHWFFYHQKRYAIDRSLKPTLEALALTYDRRIDPAASLVKADIEKLVPGLRASIDEIAYVQWLHRELSIGAERLGQHDF